MSYCSDILDGLKYIHNQGIIHEDIKLENILLQSTDRSDEYNKAKICDFGLSHIIDPSIGKAHVEVKCGTPGYMAPEISTVFSGRIHEYRKNWWDTKWICGALVWFSMSWPWPTSQPSYNSIAMVYLSFKLDRERTYSIQKNRLEEKR
jgi:serine/threonine protein kinase